MVRIPAMKSPLYLMENLPSGQLPPVLGVGLSALCLQKKEIRKKKEVVSQSSEIDVGPLLHADSFASCFGSDCMDLKALVTCVLLQSYLFDTILDNTISLI